MAEKDEPRLAEPLIIPCQFIDGIEFEVRDEFIRLVGWIYLEIVDENLTPERRIVTRAVLPVSVARSLSRELRKALAKVTH